MCFTTTIHTTVTETIGKEALVEEVNMFAKETYMLTRVRVRVLKIAFSGL
jgi:hypothetical protein